MFQRRHCSLSLISKNIFNIRMWLNSFNENGSTLSRLQSPFEAYAADGIWIHRDKRRNWLSWPISSFSTKVSTSFNNYFPCFPLDVRQNCSLSFICCMLFKMCLKRGKNKRMSVVKRLNILIIIFLMWNGFENILWKGGIAHCQQ